MTKKTCFLVTIGLLISSLAGAADLAKVAPSVSHHRRPVAVQTLDAKTAVVANRRSGTLSVIDVESLSVAAEFDIKGQPTDIAAYGNNLLVTDAENGRLMAVRIDRSAVSVLWELRVPTHPVSVRISKDDRWCAVCSLWARKVVFVRLPIASKVASTPQIIATVDLPFAPREQLIIEDSSRLIVADAFGGRLAVIRLDSHQVEAVHPVPAQNIRGLALSADGQRVLMTHQILNELSPPRRSEIIWGVMMSDAFRVLRRDKLLDPKADIWDGSRFIMVGNGTRGAGDPDAMVATDDGRVVIALAGTSEVAVVEPDGFSLQRVPVGRRPVAIARVGNDRFLVVNELSDSVSRIDLQPKLSKKSTTQIPTSKQRPRAPKTYDGDKKIYADDKVKGGSYVSGKYDRDVNSEDDVRVAVRHLSLGSSPKPGAVERGEAHFFDARLSAGGWYSCNSCHADGHTSGGLADTLGDGHEGAPKRILSLLGVTETGPWSWLGTKTRLNDQLHQSLRLTMRGRRLADRDVNDLIEFLKTLKPPPPFEPATSAADRALVATGRKLFKSLNCNSCHEGRTLTSEDVYDVGLTDDIGTKKFNPPSLRGVGHRYRLFHDNRAANVEEVVGKHKHQLPRPLTAEEQRSLIRYLRSL